MQPRGVYKLISPDRKGGVCWTHGTKDVKKICSFEGCTNLVGKEGVCITHGATKERKRCNFEICTKQAIKGGVCVTHGAKRKRCSHEGVYERWHGATKKGCTMRDVPTKPRKDTNRVSSHE